MLPCILVEKCISILALEMASPWNQHYAPPVTTRVAAVAPPKSHSLIHHTHQRNRKTRHTIARLRRAGLLATAADACCFIVMAFCSRRSMNRAASETRPGSASPPAAQNVYTTVAMSNVQPSVTSSDVADTDHTLIENDLYEREGQGHGP